jgi:hypothetical protein
MNIVPRIVITDAMIVSTNAVDSADFDLSTTYDTGDKVTDPTTKLEYESVGDGNIGNDPASDDGTNWTLLGFTNSRRMIDGLITGQTERAESITLKIDPGATVTSAVLFNVAGASVTVSVKEGGSEIYTRTIQMVRTDDVENIWDYFFTEPEFKTVAIFESFPGKSGNEITLTVSAPGATAKVGEAIFGYARRLGDTLAGSSPTIKDFSVIEENEFGELTIVERAFARGADYEVAINPQEADRIMRIMAANRARLCAFFPDSDMEHYGLTVAGFYEEFEPPLTHRGVSIVTIPVKGVT